MSVFGFRKSRQFLAKVAILTGLLAGVSHFSTLALAEETGILNLGDTVITGFSGVMEPTTEAPDPTNNSVLDETLINPDGISARIASVAAPGYIWDARVWPADLIREFHARDIGQVFGVTLDDAKFPNIYFAASSAYGLQLVLPDADNDGRPERIKTGEAGDSWMEGQWGTADTKGAAGSLGGPGSIWKVDGVTGEVSLFANVQLNGLDNKGAGLGNIAFAPAMQQLFVSDLSTGMIHRFDLAGNEIEVFDHGVTGRTAANLAPVPYDPASVVDITSSDFDTEDTETWGFTDKDRRVYALAYHDGRLYYSVVGGSQIWSVGFDKDTGKFEQSAQWELDVPKKPKALPVTDIVFTNKGAMVLAQRGAIKSTYDYLNFADYGKSRTYRYWLENPDDVNTPSRWIAEPEEYAVGFEGDLRSTDGGLDVNYGYTKEGYLDTGSCEASLWTTGDNLRNNQDLSEALLKGGALVIDGVQGMPAGPVKQYAVDNNSPPWASYMVDNDEANTSQIDVNNNPTTYNDLTTTGWMGDLVSYHVGCTGVAGGGYWGGAGYGWPQGPAYTTNTVYVPHDTEPPYVTTCTPGVDCPNDPKMCAKTSGEFTCDSSTGTWTYKGVLGVTQAMNGDAIKVTQTSAGTSIPGGSTLPFSSPASFFEMKGGAPGQLMSASLCIFNAAEAASGKPYDCCKTTIAVKAPSTICVKK